MKVRKSVATAIAAISLVAGGSVIGTVVNQQAQAADYISGSDYIDFTPSRQSSGWRSGGVTQALAIGTTGDAHLVKAVAMNITVSGPSSAGYLTAFGNTAMPNTSNVNWNAANEVSSNFCVCPVWNVGTVLYVNVYMSQTAYVTIDRFGKFQT